MKRMIPQTNMDLRAAEALRLALDFIEAALREQSARNQKENPRSLRAMATRLTRSAVALLEDR